MKVIVDDLAIEYRDEGAGETLLFLHGWKSSLHSFDALTSLLIQKYRVVRLDLPGFGGSEMSNDAWDLERYVNFVSSFISKLNLDVYAIVGHSFGGRIVIKGSSSKHLKPKKNILIGSAGVANRKTFKNYFYLIVAKTLKLITMIPPLSFWKDDLRRKLHSMIGADYYHAGSLRNTLVKIINEDLSFEATRITIPTLLIWGEDDSETPLRDGKKLSSLIKDSKLEIINHCGHFVHEENSDNVAEIIRKFL